LEEAARSDVEAAGNFARRVPDRQCFGNAPIAAGMLGEPSGKIDAKGDLIGNRRAAILDHGLSPFPFLFAEAIEPFDAKALGSLGVLGQDLTDVQVAADSSAVAKAMSDLKRNEVENWYR
jgi:hypothetical protein